MIKAIKRLDERVFGRMKQETFNTMMYVIIFAVLFGVFAAMLPGALDQWWYEQYELPVQQVKEFQQNN